MKENLVMDKQDTLTKGKIYVPLVKFTLPIMISLFLQALYGTVDLLVVGRFGTTNDISGVATGGAILLPITIVLIGFAMGITILVGQRIGRERPYQAGRAIGAGIFIFLVISIVLFFILSFFSKKISILMNAPVEAIQQTTDYIRYCGFGIFFIVGYNLLGSIFRGLGDSKTPLITVIIACIINIIADLIFVAYLKMGAKGAALATVLSQGISLLISIMFIKKMNLPIVFSLKTIKFTKEFIGKEISLGGPIAVQDFLVGMSFMLLQVLGNKMGLEASAGIGVASRICALMILVPESFFQSFSAFTAQNIGAHQLERIKKGLYYSIETSFCVGLGMFYMTLFHGDILTKLFTNDKQVILSAFEYLKAFSFDSMFTSFLFILMGYLIGIEKTLFVMIQGMIGAVIRTAFAFIVVSVQNPSLFKLGLSTPCATMVQIVLCLISIKLIHKNRHQS